MNLQKLQHLWDKGLSLIQLNSNLTPIRKNWQTDSEHWITDETKLATRPDPITKQPIPIVPPHIGVLTGAPSGNVYVLDVDNKNNTPFLDVLQFLETSFGISEETTLASTTKSNGLHLYIRLDPTISLGNRIGIPISSIPGKTGLDFKGNGGYVVASPTPKYNFVNDLPILNVFKDTHPEFYVWWNEKADSEHNSETASLEDRLFEAFTDTGISKGERNDKIFKIGAKLAYRFINDPECFTFVYGLLIAGADRATPKYRGPKEDAELESIARRCIQWQIDNVKGILPAETSPTPQLTTAQSPHWYDLNQYDALNMHSLPVNELGFVHRVLSLKPNLVWRPDTNSWWYKDVIWRSFSEYQGIDNIMHLCLEIIQADKKAGSDIKHTARLEAMTGKIAIFEGFLKMLRTKTAIEDDRFNSTLSRDWIGFTNGALNIKTREFLPEIPDNIYATTAFDYDYLPELSTPGDTKNWDQLISYMFQDDPELIDFFPILLGYCLLGQNKDNKFFLFIGKADAGKSTLSRILTKIFGGNASHNLSPQIFAGGGLSEGTRAASLIPASDARLVIADEVGPNDHLKEEDIKRITGGDVITIRENYARKNFSYIARFTPIMIGNVDPPFFSAASPALKRRLAKIQLKHAVPAEVRTAYPTLEEDAITEAPAVMNLILKGIDTYLACKDRIDILFPKSIQTATAQYFEDADIFRGFIHEELVFDPAAKGRAHNMKAAFLAYQERYMQGEMQKKLTINSLNNRLRDAGAYTYQSHGVSYWQGVRLCTPTESINGMVLQANNDIIDKSPISVTFGDILDPVALHDDNEQNFVGQKKKTQLKVVK